MSKTLGLKNNFKAEKKTTSFMVVFLSTLSVPNRSAGPNKRAGGRIS